MYTRTTAYTIDINPHVFIIFLTNEKVSRPRVYHKIEV